jgi:hypothetical protein
MNAEELFERGMELIDHGAQYAPDMAVASAYFMAAQARKTIDSQDAILVGLQRASEPTQPSSPGFEPVTDLDGDAPYLDTDGYVRYWSSGAPFPTDRGWRRLYARVPS